ncbi:MAG: hypothetical protein CL678_01125 [Bdellovibrionaceae bacterium]|nr:hypothetical protein [Pseudobdellovibrionaceae bacterium]
MAALYRQTVIEKMPRKRGAAVDGSHIEALIALVKTYAIKCTYESYADSYVSAVLKAIVPFDVASLVPRDLPPYSHAATYLGADCNETMRPILKTPLRSVLSAADWGPHDLRGYFAAAVTLRELTGGVPRLYVNAELAEAKESESAVFALSRKIASGGCGVVHRGQLIFYDTPLHALYAWITLNKSDPVVNELAAKLDCGKAPEA